MPTTVDDERARYGIEFNTITITKQQTRIIIIISSFILPPPPLHLAHNLLAHDQCRATSLGKFRFSIIGEMMGMPCPNLVL